MSDLTDFLIARIAEDEASIDRRDQTWESVTRDTAEVEAKRRIVERLGWWLDDPNPDPDPIGILFIAQQMASVYADHPDYRDEWRP